MEASRVWLNQESDLGETPKSQAPEKIQTSSSTIFLEGNFSYGSYV
jgi:hypothetical protein